MPATISTEANDVTAGDASPFSSESKENISESISSESSGDISEPISLTISLKKEILVDQKLKKKALGLGNLDGGVSGHIDLRKLPSKRVLTVQLQVSAGILDDARKETYQKKFRLWSKKPLSLSRARLVTALLAHSSNSLSFVCFSPRPRQ
jgi:hypothetical protein